MKERFILEGFFPAIVPPAGLVGRIGARIMLARRRAARFRLAALCALAATSGALLVPALQYAGQEFYESGFYDYASLLLSDRAFALTSWRELSYSLIESLPSLAVLILAACITAFVWSAWRAVRNAKIAFFSSAGHSSIAQA